MQEAMRHAKHRTSSSGGLRSKSQPRSSAHRRSTSRDSSRGPPEQSPRWQSNRDGLADVEFRKMIKEFRDRGVLLERSSSTASACRAPSPSPRPSSATAASAKSPNLCVYVRKRPMSAEEYRLRMFDVVTVMDDRTMVVHEPKTKVDMTRVLDNHSFRFDAAFDESATNETVYKVRAPQPLLYSAIWRCMPPCACVAWQLTSLRCALLCCALLCVVVRCCALLCVVVRCCVVLWTRRR